MNDLIEVDVVVAGSGAGGLSAAISAACGGCSVLVLEAADQIGGTTAFGGGAAWVPCNRQMKALGIEDSRADALAYIYAVAADQQLDTDLVETFVDRCNEAIEFLAEHSPVRLVASSWLSDYYAPCTGGKRGGRSMSPAIFASRTALAEWDLRVRTSPHTIPLTLDELRGAADVEVDENVTGVAAGTVPLSRDFKALAQARRCDGVRALGEALAAMLLRGALDAGVDVRTGFRVRRLLRDPHGAITGIEADGTDGPVRVVARCGVVLATGGFEWNPDLVRTFLGVSSILPLSPPHNVGDGLMMGTAVGAAVANMTSIWGFPATYDGYSQLEGFPLGNANTPRHEAGCIAINQHGRRFINEGICYMDFSRVHRTFDPLTRTRPNASPAWFLFDKRVRDRIELGDLQPGKPTPDWVLEAPTLPALAGKMGVDPVVLGVEVERFSANARNFVDPDFGCGTIWFEGVTVGGPRPETLLAPIDTPPYYAMRMYDGAIGTAGGLKTDRDARVLTFDGDPIVGLYAAGNAAASIFGPVYPAGGSTLGPALTFGYLAGRHLAARKADSVTT